MSEKYQNERIEEETSKGEDKIWYSEDKGNQFEIVMQITKIIAGMDTPSDLELRLNPLQYFLIDLLKQRTSEKKKRKEEI